MARCASNRCNSGRKDCPTPIECGISPPDVPKPIGFDQDGPYEELELADWTLIASGIIKGVVVILILLLVVFAVAA